MTKKEEQRKNWKKVRKKEGRNLNNAVREMKERKKKQKIQY